MNQNSKKVVSVICPVHNEEGSIPIFYERMINIFNKLAQNYSFELIFINDGSNDNSYSLLHKLYEKDKRIKIISFTKNFGHQAAILAGYKYSSGEYIFQITVSCQDPPETLILFLKTLEEGYDIVYGIRDKRPENFILQKLRKLFYRTLKYISDIDIILNMNEFALITKEVKETVLLVQNQIPFIRAEIANSGFKRKGINYEIQPRLAGKSHYNLKKMTSYALAGILSVSTFPLRLIIYFMPILLIINFISIIFKISYNTNDLILYSLIFDSIIISFSLSFIGLYIARIYKNIVKRPIYVIDMKKSFFIKTSEKL
ncbi:MAG TPA: glycosyltransferase family 2 protein [Bacteroidota bacterium]|nr:glycosyltransferase family 2 protein [Bacteroidota bacterium]